MGKRFGRNKRRDLRAAIAERDVALAWREREAANARSARSSLNNLERAVLVWDREIVETLGRVSALRLKAETERVGKVTGGRYDYQLPISMFDMMYQGDDQVASIVSTHVQQLQMLQYEVQDSPLDMRRLISFRQTDGYTTVLRVNQIINHEIIHSVSRHRDSYIADVVSAAISREFNARLKERVG